MMIWLAAVLLTMASRLKDALAHAPKRAMSKISKLYTG